MNYVIIGNSAAGLSALQAIRERDKTGSITVVSEEVYDAYSRPLISYYLKDKVTYEKMLLRAPGFMEDNNVKLIKGVKATNVTPDKKTVSLADGTKLPYDRLLLATGSVPFVPPVEGMAKQENVFTFLDLGNSDKIKKYVRPGMRAVVIGGGLIGLKAAEGLHKVCPDVTVLELADRILPTILDAQGAAVVTRRLVENGINLMTGNTAVKINGTDKVESLTLKSGETLPCDILVMAVGVRPNTELAKLAGIEVGRGIITDEHMRTSVADIYAAGDVTESLDTLDGSKKILALWPNAVQQGKAAGDSMAGGDRAFGGAFAINAIDFFDMRISTCGITGTEENGFVNIVRADETSYRRFVTKDDTLKGYIIIGDISRAGLYTSLIRNGMKLSEISGDIFGSVEFRELSPEQREKLLGGVSA